MAISIAGAYFLSNPDPPHLQIFVLVIMAVTCGEIILVERVFARSVLSPLAQLVKASRHIVRGNYRFEFAGVKGKQNSHNDDLLQIAKAFAILRDRVVELEQLLAKSKEEKEKVQETSTHHIADKERELERRNAMLIGNAEELEKTISDLYIRNGELTQAYEKLEKLDKTKTEFLLIAAHELRTPIQPLLGFARLAEKGLLDRQVAWKSIETEAKKLADMASDILDAGRIESGSFSYKMKRVSVREFLDGVTSGSPKLFNGSGAVAIVRDFDYDAEIMADATRLNQAVLNIVANAVKFGGNSQITIRTRNIVLRGVVEIKVIDGGMGISPEILPVLFNKFVTKTEANQRGAGLGLYIARSIIEAHGGNVGAENNPGGGATFTIVLPFVKEAQNAAFSRTDLEIPH